MDEESRVDDPANGTGDEATAEVLGLLDGEPSTRAVAHLLAGCEACRRELARALGPVDPPALDGVLARLLDRLEAAGARARVEREMAPILIERLLRHPQGRRLTIARSSWQHQSPPVVEQLLRESRARLGTDLPGAVQLAELACESADRLAPADYGEVLTHDLRGRARIGLALALRTGSRFQEAESILAGAEGLLAAGSGEPRERGALLEERGELYSRMKRAEEARHVLRRAATLYLGESDYGAVGRVLHRLARSWAEIDEPRFEARALIAAAELTDARADGRLAMVIAHNLLESLLEAGDRQRALALIQVALPAYEIFASPTDRMFVRWTQARVLAASGRLREALEPFRVARERFVELSMPVEAALCALDAAIVHLELGELGEVEAIAAEIVPTLDSRRLGREALAAVALFRRAARDEATTASMIRAVAQALRSRAGRSKS